MCHLNQEVSVDTIKEINPDVIILATGSTPIIPPIPGIEKSIITTPSEILNDRKPEKKRSVVVGGGATGCEIAHHLSENGCPVTIVEMLPKIATQLESITRKVLLGQLKKNHVQFLANHKVIRIEDDGVFVAQEDGSEVLIKAENVVIAIGNKPDDRLHEQIQSMGIPLHKIGDCLEPRSAKAAIYEGAIIGRTI